MFWWDNFDKKIDRAGGGGSIHFTPGIAFQEEVIGTEHRVMHTSMERSKRRSLKLPAPEPVAMPKIDPKKDPQAFHQRNDSRIDTTDIDNILTMWKLLRYGSSSHDFWARFAGFITKLFQKNKCATTMTYLPPIPTPIMEYPTIVDLFYVSRNLAKNANMKYVHITMDVGAAIKAFHVVWDDNNLWNDIIIHLSDFHAVMAFFGVIGQYITGSGFEKNAYQSRLASAVSIKKLLSGKHYNCCWWVHEIIHDALERLFFQRLLGDDEENIQSLQEDKEVDGARESVVSEDARCLIKKYQEMKKMGIDGEFGKTPQFWLKYMEMVSKLHQLHFALNTNNLMLKINSWEYFLPLCFMTNKIHYSRYGTYYIQLLRNLSSTRPGAFEEFEQMTAVRRNTIGIGQVTDLAGEQTYMRNAKTTGNYLV